MIGETIGRAADRTALLAFALIGEITERCFPRTTDPTSAATPAADAGAAAVSEPPTTPAAAPTNVHPADARHHGNYALWLSGDRDHPAVHLVPLTPLTN